MSVTRTRLSDLTHPAIHYPVRAAERPADAGRLRRLLQDVRLCGRQHQDRHRGYAEYGQPAHPDLESLEARQEAAARFPVANLRPRAPCMLSHCCLRAATAVYIAMSSGDADCRPSFAEPPGAVMFPAWQQRSTPGAPRTAELRMPPMRFGWEGGRTVILRSRWDSVPFVIGEDEFWQLVKTLGRNADDDDFDRLVARLASRPEADITGFADRLAAALWALDTPAHHAAAGTASDDVFLYIRCAAVVGGRRTYDRVLRRPATLRKFADDEAELLLTVAERAYERATGSLWEHETPVSYETGGNAAAWGHDSAAPPAAEAAGWLELTLGTGMRDSPPRAYAMLLDGAVAAVAADPAWQRWWEPTGVPACRLSLLLDGGEFSPPEATVQKGRKRVQVNVTRDPGRFPVDDPPALLSRAADDLRDLLDRAGKRLGLGPLPPLPAPAVPADLPAELFRPGPDPLSMLPADLVERLMHGEVLDPEDVVDQLRRRGAGGPPS
jgi:uncharacterized protein DUF4240